jgi:hypothetical protein
VEFRKEELRKKGMNETNTHFWEPYLRSEGYELKESVMTS